MATSDFRCSSRVYSWPTLVFSFLLTTYQIISEMDPNWPFLLMTQSKLYRLLDTPNSALLLQQDLNYLVTWSVTSNMTFSPSKCKTLHISKKKNPTNARPYYLGDQSLESVPQVKDLGITISDKLQWADHIEVMTTKTNRTLGMIKRVCYDVNDQSVRKLLYCSLVLPQLEYFVPVCGHHTQLSTELSLKTFKEEPQSLY